MLEAILLRCSSERCSANMKQPPREQLCRRVILIKIEYLLLGEHLWGLFLYAKRVLKDLNYLQLLKKIYSRTKLASFFHSSYFTFSFYIK